MRAGMGLFLFIDFVNIALNLMPCRNQAMAFFKIDEKKTLNHFLVTDALLWSAAIISFLYPDILGLLGISGGIFCTFIGWVIPLLIIIRLKGRPKVLISRTQKVVYFP